jgi:hypothetical protein
LFRFLNFKLSGRSGFTTLVLIEKKRFLLVDYLDFSFCLFVCLFVWLKDVSNGGGQQRQGRQFVVTFHLTDGTLSVFEPASPNSGQRGGPFLARMKYKKHLHHTCTTTRAEDDDGGRSLSHLVPRVAPRPQLHHQQQQRQQPNGSGCGGGSGGGYGGSGCSDGKSLIVPSLLSRMFVPSDFFIGADVTFELPSTGLALHRFQVKR